MLYVSIGIIGATVMPHNLYLHSSIVQTRKYEQNAGGKREAIKFATIDSTVALDVRAASSTAAILVLAAAAFHWSGHQDVAEIQDAYKLLPGAARRDRREHFVRRRVAGVGAKLHAHRHARRPDRDGRIHQHPAAPVAAPADHARHRHRSRRLRHRLFWRKQDHATARRQPGRAVHAARLCRLAADAFHRRKSQDGRVRESALDQNSRLDDRRDYHCPQRETAL